MNQHTQDALQPIVAQTQVAQSLETLPSTSAQRRSGMEQSVETPDFLSKPPCDRSMLKLTLV
ncbi:MULTISPECIES: hypothetical protein [unclassified Phormidesmis]